MENLFNDIANGILKKTIRENAGLESYYGESNYQEFNNNYGNFDIKELRSKLQKKFKKDKIFSECIGTHPNFLDIGNRKVEQYIVSVFIDIKGSTKLATIKGLSLEEVREIKNKILTTAIAIFQVFDGHIHRLQGDAIFAYFGHKMKTKSDAIIDSLNAVTVLNYIFSEYVTKQFEEKGYPEIKIRAGIDFGDDKEVLWSKYGLGNCEEITTTSIHTDLAAKLQNRAKSNSVMIGDNVKEFLDIPKEFYSVKMKQKNLEKVEEKYILEHSEFRYKMWEFNWKKYSIRFPQLENESNNLPIKRLTYVEGKDYIVECYHKEPEEKIWKLYNQNLGAIPKKHELKFNLKIQDPIINLLGKNIIWEVNNRGKEAEEAKEDLNFVYKTSLDGDCICPQQTAYKGHHYMKMIIKGQSGQILGESYFGIYVRN